MRTRTPSLPLRLVAAAASVVLLAACSRDATDPALTDAGLTEDIPVGEDGATDAVPMPDVPGVTDATPSDDVATDGSSEEPNATAQVPPLLAEVDGWPETTVTLEGDEPTSILAKVADEPDRRQQGLMNVEELPDGVGMLFLFDEPRTGGFWMMNTLVPLDIAYILDGEVVSVMQMEPCGDQDPCPTYDPEVEYDAALEVNLGALEAAGIGEGTTVAWTAPIEVAPA